MTRITLKDIAEHSDVSIGTVSRVLSRKQDVQPEYVRRVMEAAEALGYDRHLTRSSPQPSSVSTPMPIGMLINKPASHDLRADEYEAGYLESIAEHMTRSNMHMMFKTCHEDIELDRLPDMVADQMVQGVIIKNLRFEHANWVKRIAQQVPVVLMGSPMDASYIGVNSVLDNGVLSMQHAVQFIQSLGHERIGFFSVRNPSLISHDCDFGQQRANGFGDVIKRFEIPTHPDYFQMPMHDNRIEPLSMVAERVIQTWLAMGSQRPTAVICVSDYHAMAIYEACSRLKVGIPNDLTVIGFGNTYTAAHAYPPMTSLAFPASEAARLAVELLQQIIEKPEQPVHQVLTAAQVYERQSHCVYSPKSSK
jgi:DNA-binding LacI/PurR family transcriptional regulator